MDEMEDPESAAVNSERTVGRQDERTPRRERARSTAQAGPMARLSQFLRDVRAELKRVSWPSGKEVKNTTIITLVAVIFFATYLFAVDQAWARLINGLDWILAKLVG